MIDAEGQLLTKARIVDGLDFVARLHALIGNHAADSNDVVVGAETDRGLLVEALVAGGYQVYAINPFAASRYRDRHVTSGAKSDPGDAKVLAELVRTDRHNQAPSDGRRLRLSTLERLLRNGGRRRRVATRATEI